LGECALRQAYLSAVDAAIRAVSDEWDLERRISMCFVTG
jgi:hypothetical protein